MKGHVSLERAAALQLTKDRLGALLERRVHQARLGGRHTLRRKRNVTTGPGGRTIAR